MRRRLSSPLAVILLVAALPLALAATAAADDWQLLGRRQVSFVVDKDVIDAGARGGLFNLPGAARVIRRIDFSYRSVRGGRWSRATVHVYGRR